MSVLTRLLAAGQRVLLVGPPGIAKTARAVAAAAANNHKLMVVRASLSERVDLGGALVPDTKAGVTRTLPLEWLHQLRNTDEPTVLFLDDLGQAPVDVQASAMRLFDDGQLPDNVVIWGATNRPGDKAGVTALCEPLRSRFHLAFAIATPATEVKRADGAVFLQPWHGHEGLTPIGEVTDWCEWAMSNNAAPEIVAWHRSTSGRTLYQWKPHADPGVRMPDYRSWGTVINLWAAGLRDLDTLAAALGYPTAAEFTAFAALADKVPTPDQVRLDPKGAPVPDDPSSQYLIVSMLAAAAKPQDAGPFVTYMTRLPRVFGALLGRDLYKTMGAKLSGQKSWTDWFVENQQLFL